MGFKCGIVGLPNVGKSTLFNALTASKNAEAANFPFCTIDPNIGVVDVVDERLDKLSKLSNSKKKIYTNITFVDIAGLVKGASKGEGLGNNNELKNDSFEINTGSPHFIQFMSNINQLDFLTYCKSIRNNKKYKKNGININLVEERNSNLMMRTFERGVENETLSCGSGVTAAAIAFGYRKTNINKVHIQTPGGDLTVEFKMNKSTFSEIYLSGPSSFVYKGELNI